MSDRSLTKQEKKLLLFIGLNLLMERAEEALALANFLNWCATHTQEATSLLGILQGITAKPPEEAE